jgi:hypothetical protein
MIKKITSQKEAVTYWLTAYPPSRDNDELLVGCIWSRIIGKDRLDVITSRQMLHMMANGELPSFDAITRMRRKIQETNIHLRGTTYLERQNRSLEVKQDINTI